MPSVPPPDGDVSDGGRLWFERGALVGLVAVYLWAMRTELPNGDGRVYMNQIEAGALVWNPNHLLMQPIGLWWWHATQALGLGWTLFDALRVLVGVSATASILLFHTSLRRLLGPAPATRLLATLALFFSAHFLSMAIAEEYYMIQMPLLAAALLLAVDWADHRADQTRRRGLLAAIGVLTALATAVSINNLLLAFALGLAAGLRPHAGRRFTLADTLAVWVPCALVGVPLFVGLYLASGGGGFVRWLTAYQGQASNASTSLYGIQWTPSGVVVSLATLAYGFASSLFTLGQLGAVVEGLARGRSLEFLPAWTSIVSSGLLFLMAAALLLPFAWWAATRSHQRAIGRIGLAWIAAYLAFNFLWVDTSDQFWFTLLPAFWLLIALFLTQSPADGSGAPAPPGWRRAVLWIVVPMLAVGNSLSVVGPRAFAHTAERRAEFAAFVHDDDLFITTGWDDLLWMPPAIEQRRFERVLLMDLALRERRGERAMDDLPERMRAHLARGHRVVVARVFDRDREGRPWEQLAKLRWPRPRLQELFAGFDHRPIATIDGVVFHEVRSKD